TLDDRQVQRALESLSPRGLPNLFIPRRDHFIRVDAIPMLGTGKLDLRAIRRVAEEALSPSTLSATSPGARLGVMRTKMLVNLRSRRLLVLESSGAKVLVGRRPAIVAHL